MNLNKVLLLGNLTRDPDLRALTNGGSIATFGLATNRTVKKDGKKVDVPEYHNIVAYGGQAESCAQYLKKGSIAHVEGRIQTRSFDKEGVKMYRTEVIADRVQFGPRPGSLNGPKSDVASESDTDQRPPSERGSGEATASAAPIPYPEEDINPDDIPF
jgi:single-strand DNA-binding protein